jgi:hypothetical protein
MGTGSARTRRAGQLVYAMKVTETMTFDDYWEDDRFKRKRPVLAGSRKIQFGDNIYHRDARGAWLQEDSRHSRADGRPEMEHVRRDTETTTKVLLSTAFSYFGASGPPIPTELRQTGFDIVSGRGHRSHFTADLVMAADLWMNNLPRGIHGDPLDWGRLRAR